MQITRSPWRRTGPVRPQRDRPTAGSAPSPPPWSWPHPRHAPRHARMLASTTQAIAESPGKPTSASLRFARGRGQARSRRSPGAARRRRRVRRRVRRLPLLTPHVPPTHLVASSPPQRTMMGSPRITLRTRPRDGDGATVDTHGRGAAAVEVDRLSHAQCSRHPRFFRNGQSQLVRLAAADGDQQRATGVIDAGEGAWVLLQRPPVGKGWVIRMNHPPSRG